MGEFIWLVILIVCISIIWDSIKKDLKDEFFGERKTLEEMEWERMAYEEKAKKYLEKKVIKNDVDNSSSGSNNLASTDPAVYIPKTKETKTYTNPNPVHRTWFGLYVQKVNRVPEDD